MVGKAGFDGAVELWLREGASIEIGAGVASAGLAEGGARRLGGGGGPAAATAPLPMPAGVEEAMAAAAIEEADGNRDVGADGKKRLELHDGGRRTPEGAALSRVGVGNGRIFGRGGTRVGAASFAPSAEASLVPLIPSRHCK